MKKSNRIVSIPRFTIFVALCTAILIFGGSFLWNQFGLYYANADSIESYETVRVSAGDSLWSIAQENYPEQKDLRKVIYSIEKINSLDGSEIFSGQELQLPMYID